MNDRSHLEKLYRDELHALSVFSEKSARRTGFAVSAEDPDVRRLVEAMAFFAARTRAAAADATMAAIVRMAGGTLDDLFAPLPAAAMVQLVANESVVGEVHLERGTLLRFAATGHSAKPAQRSTLLASRGRGSDEHVGLFTTTAPVTLRPIQVERARLTGPRFAQELELQLRAHVPQCASMKLDLFIKTQGDYEDSLELHAALAHHAQRTTVRFGSDDTDVPCAVQFGGRRPGALADGGDGDSPMQRLRSFFQFPQQDLFVCIDVPARETDWTTLTVRFALDSDWPEVCRVSADAFLLHVVPAANRWFDFSAPIAFDGTRSEIPVEYPLATPGAVEPRAVRGIYQVDRAMQPLLPFAVGHRGDGYELLRAADRPLRLRVRIADAFGSPRKLLADVEWSQPTLWEVDPGPVSVSLQEKAIAGLTVRLEGRLAAPLRSPLLEDPARCLDVLALKMRGVLDRDALVSLMVLLGASGESAYSACPSSIATVSVRDAADPGLRAGGIKHVYDVALRGPRDGIVGRFAEQIRALLDAWTQDAVNVRASFTASPTV